MTLAASVVQASMIAPSQSYRIRIRPFSQLIVRSTNPAPLPQATAVGLPLGNVRLDPEPPQQRLGRLAVGPPAMWIASGTPWRSIMTVPEAGLLRVLVQN